MTDLHERYTRQQQILPADRLAACHCTVVGVGAIGRQLAIQLAAIGTPKLRLVDPDTVETVNLGCQAFLEADLGSSKVAATAAFCQQLNSEVEITPCCERFRRRAEIGNVLFCCVDSIETRRLVWDAVRDRVLFFADSRMSAETLRVLTVTGPDGREHYPATLFRSSEAYVGACAARSTVFCANIAAGMMLEQFSRWLRRIPTDLDLQFNLLASELHVFTA